MTTTTPARTVLITRERRAGQHYVGRLLVGGVKTNRRVRGSLGFVVERVPRLLGQERAS